MIYFTDGNSIPKRFGDFAINFAVSDDADATLNYPVAETEKILQSDSFENDFRSFLKCLYPNELIIKKKSINNVNVLVAPALGAYYNLAGWLALAKAEGIKDIAMGTYDDKIALKLASVANTNGFNLTLIASAKQSKDETFLNSICETGTQVDTETCVKYFDYPYTYLEVLFGKPTTISIPASANYGAFPKPQLAGMFAGVYGTDLAKALKEIPEACIVSTSTGLDAISVFKEFSKTQCKLATYESVVTQEFHVVDTMCYTIKVRRDDDPIDVMICPELANMWRLGTVARLGCDRVVPADTTLYEQAGLDKKTASAVVEMIEKFDKKEILVLEKVA